MSNTSEAIVIEATRAISRGGREHAYVREIAAEANRLLEARGETVRLNPEKVGHRLKSLGLRTHRLTLAGNGLTFDKVTIALIEQLAAVYVEEDLLAETENLHDS
jgi:precorrin-6B methylase 1